MPRTTETAKGFRPLSVSVPVALWDRVQAAAATESARIQMPVTLSNIVRRAVKHYLDEYYPETETEESL
jgi:hypothetical protein